MKTIEELLKELARMAEALTSKETKDVAAFHAAAGVCKEAGELLGLEDKVSFQGHEMDYLKLRVEAGDMMFYLLRYLDLHGIPFRECLIAVIAKLNARYKGGEFRAWESTDRNAKEERRAIEAALLADGKVQ